MFKFEATLYLLFAGFMAAIVLLYMYQEGRLIYVSNYRGCIEKYASNLRSNTIPLEDLEFKGRECFDNGGCYDSCTSECEPAIVPDSYVKSVSYYLQYMKSLHSVCHMNCVPKCISPLE